LRDSLNPYQYLLSDHDYKNLLIWFTRIFLLRIILEARCWRDHHHEIEGVRVPKISLQGKPPVYHKPWVFFNFIWKGNKFLYIKPLRLWCLFVTAASVI
jgi:hypothetical protein